MDSQISRQFVVGFAAAVALVAAAFSYAASVREERIGEFSPYVSKDGAISRPTNYRDTFQHIGTSAVATKPGQPVDELHNVYSRPEDVRAYRRDGKFPDGAVLVNEVTLRRLGNAHVRAVPPVRGDQELVHHGQGLKRAIPRQRPLGRRMGLGHVQAQRSRQERCNRLLERLQGVPCPGQEGRMGVRARISGSSEWGLNSLANPLGGLPRFDIFTTENE